LSKTANEGLIEGPMGFAGALDRIIGERNENPTSKLVIISRAHSAPSFISNATKEKKERLLLVFAFLLAFAKEQCCNCDYDDDHDYGSDNDVGISGVCFSLR
jgi:hypothetical protein